MRLRFVCEGCGNVYECREDALDCETKHTRPLGMVSSYYRQREAFPDEVRVSFMNGKTQIYVRKAVVEDLMVKVREKAG